MGLLSFDHVLCAGLVLTSTKEEPDGCRDISSLMCALGTAGCFKVGEGGQAGVMVTQSKAEINSQAKMEHPSKA